MRTSGYGINAKQMGLVRQRSTIAKAQARTIEQASSGKRINRAADDVARLAASTQMKVRADALAVANRNLNDVTSLLQTAEGGMESAGNIIKRMTELATHASSAGLSEEQRGYLIHEFEALKVDLDHLAETVEYNGEKMLGEGICVSFQSGPDASSDSRYHFELRQPFYHRNFPIPPGEVRATLQDFVNEPGDTMTFNLLGLPISFATFGTADQQANADSLEAALSANATALQDRGISFTKSGATIEFFKANGCDYPPSLNVDSIANIDNTPSIDETVATLSNFVNTAGHDMKLVIEGVEVTFTAAGTANQATNATRLETALTAQAAALSAVGVAFSRSGSGSAAQKTDFSADNAPTTSR